MSNQDVTVYADFAGNPADDAQTSQTYVTILCNSREYSEVHHRCDILRYSLERYGVDVHNPEFEFHAYDIFCGEGFMKPIFRKEELRYQVAEKLRIIIRSLELRYILVKIDKPIGVSSLDTFSKEIQHTVEKEVAKIPQELVDKYNRSIYEKFGDKNFGSMATCYHLLLGLTSGLLHWSGYREEANLIVDKKFVDALDLFNFVLNMGEYTWPIFRESVDFSQWPNKGKPDWHIEGHAVEKDSYSEYGIQLADYLAYTFKRIGKDGFDANRFCATTNLTQFKDSPGMFFKASGYSKSRAKPYYSKLHKHSHPFLNL